MMSSSSSILFPILTTIAMDSASTSKMAFLFKPLHLNLRRGRDRALIQQQLKLNLHHQKYVMPLRCSAASAGGGDSQDAILLHVGGMMCEGCAANVKRILESRAEVSSATVNLTSETALVSPLPEVKTELNWQQQLGEQLAHHLTTCGFTSTFPGQGEMENKGVINSP